MKARVRNINIGTEDIYHTTNFVEPMTKYIGCIIDVQQATGHKNIWIYDGWRFSEEWLDFDYNKSIENNMNTKLLEQILSEVKQINNSKKEIPIPKYKFKIGDSVKIKNPEDVVYNNQIGTVIELPKPDCFYVYIIKLDNNYVLFLEDYLELVEKPKVLKVKIKHNAASGNYWYSCLIGYKTDDFFKVIDFSDISYKLIEQPLYIAKKECEIIYDDPKELIGKKVKIIKQDSNYNKICTIKTTSFSDNTWLLIQYKKPEEYNCSGLSQDEHSWYNIKDVEILK
jgi:hypothetical protein